MGTAGRRELTDMKEFKLRTVSHYLVADDDNFNEEAGFCKKYLKEIFFSRKTLVVYEIYLRTQKYNNIFDDG